MNFIELLQAMGVTALVTLLLVLFVACMRDSARAWLQRRLRPRFLKPAGVRRRAPGGRP
ncbi:cellulose biosynthesis protein BcsF [Pseudomonas putida]